MKRAKPFSQEAKAEIISRFKQSGLSQNQFCKLPEVPIAISTLSTWLSQARGTAPKVSNAKKKAKTPVDLNIVCYTMGEKSGNTSNGGNGQESTLPEMIKFQQDVYDCCSRLYRLSCNEQSIRLLSQIKGAL